MELFLMTKLGRIRAYALKVLFSGVFLCVVGCSDDHTPESDNASRTPWHEKSASEKTLTVYKTANCSCCKAWVSHIEAGGFNADVVNQASVSHVKDLYGIPANARSCHTAVTDNQYVFEGHVPAKFVRQFLVNPPVLSLGLVVPAMPLGSPGMEYKDQFQPYTIYSLLKNGELAAYAKVDSYQQQF